MRIAAAPAFSNRPYNAYNSLLYQHIQPLVDEVVEFDPKPLFPQGKPPDVLHVHWPDLTIRNAARPRNLLSAGLKYLTRLQLLKRRGTRLVWTVHNLAPHEASAHPRSQAWFYRNFLALLDGAIFLSHASRQEALQAFPALQNLPQAVIPHGHYRPVLSGNLPDRAAARQLLGLPDDGSRMFLYFGQIRDYKNVPLLIREFQAANLENTILAIAGQPGDAALRQQIEDLAAPEPHRIFLDLRHIPDETLYAYLAACDCVALPYRQILNSGSVLMALSADRPVIAPGIGSLTEVSEQVGTQWVQCYSGDFEAAYLRKALLNLPESGAKPDLSPYDWPAIARQTVDFYLQVCRGHQTKP